MAKTSVLKNWFSLILLSMVDTLRTYKKTVDGLKYRFISRVVEQVKVVEKECNMSDNFYRVFEARFRGSSEDIKKKLEIYLPFLESFPAGEKPLSALDLGCGRGEWIGMLAERGVAALGIDVDDAMLDACRAKNLSVEKGDVVIVLQSQEGESRDIISAIHLVEHLEFDQLRLLVAEAHRVLRPGGLLIMETPNPENIQVATTHFYLDPTHRRPIPPPLLSFLPEYCGFDRVKIFRLNGARHCMKNDGPMLLDVFRGVSPDYAVVAQKAGPPDLKARFDSVFEKETGVTLDQLTRRYDAKIDRIRAAADKVQQGFLWRISHWVERKLLRR
jgi:O-antigen chain-terminating methyltransferase